MAVNSFINRTPPNGYPPFRYACPLRWRFIILFVRISSRSWASSKHFWRELLLDQSLNLTVKSPVNRKELTAIYYCLSVSCDYGGSISSLHLWHLKPKCFLRTRFFTWRKYKVFTVNFYRIDFLPTPFLHIPNRYFTWPTWIGTLRLFVIRSSYRSCSMKIGVLGNFAKFTGKSEYFF